MLDLQTTVRSFTSPLAAQLIPATHRMAGISYSTMCHISYGQPSESRLFYRYLTFVGFAV
jgi:hypothetical protein